MDKSTLFNLNALQKAYWLGRGKEIQWGGCSCQAVFEIRMNHLDPDRFRRSLQQVIDSQPMLSAVVQTDMRMVIDEEAEIPLKLYDYSNRKDYAACIAALKKKMKYEQVPIGERLFDIHIIQKPNKRFSILIKIDMVMADLGSMHLFFRELSRAYDGKETSKPNYTFREYMNVLEDYEKTDAYKRHRAYWEHQAELFPTSPGFPANVTNGENPTDLFHRRQLRINPKRWKLFCEKAVSAGLTPSIAVLYLYSQILSAWGGGRNFAVAVTVADRKRIHQDVPHIIGEFTKVLLLPIEIREQPNKENAGAMQKSFWQHIKHVDYDATGFRKTIYEKNGESRYYPFVFTSGLGVGSKPQKGGFQDKIVWVESTTPQVILDHQIFPYKNGVVLAWDCREDAFIPGVLDQMFCKYTELFNQSIEDPDFWNQTIWDFRTQESIDTQNKVNDTKKDFELTMLHERTWEIAEAMPDKCAIIHQGKEYSYKQLTDAAEHIAAMLEHQGIPKQTRVMVAMRNSFEAIAAIMGILCYGCSYVPVMHNLPSNRIRTIYNIAEAAGIFLDSERAELEDCRILSVAQRKPEMYPILRGRISQEAYVIFTSGSTGEPKGVMITHQAAMNTILDVNERNHVGRFDRAIALSSLSFDLSVYDIFGMLNIGASLVIPTEEEKIDPALIDSLCVNHDVTLWNTVPKYCEIYLDYLASKEKKNHLINKIFLSGDWIPLRLVGLIKDHCGQAKLTSMGGATEASIWSNYYEVEELEETWNSIPYGYPLANQKFYIFDELGRPCPDYVSGLLHIQGEGLALGYANAPDITKAAFYTHPFNKERVYNTGDYGRYDKNGVIEFLGRKDTQIKVNGYRIEIGEINKAFSKCQITEYVVLPLGRKMENKKLVAFIKEEGRTDDLRKQLEEMLPSYAIPDPIYVIDEIPKTANKKIDRKMLEKMAEEREAEPVTEEGNEILDIISDVLNMKSIKNTDSFASLGVSSMELIGLANELDKKFGHRPTVGEMMQYANLSGLVQYYRTAAIQEKPEVVEDELEQIRTDELSVIVKTLSYKKIKDWLESGKFKKAIQQKLLQEELEKRVFSKSANNGMLIFLEDALNVNDIQVTDNFFRLGVSSVEIMNIANELETRYGVRPSVGEMMRYDTFQELVDFYAGREEIQPSEDMEKGQLPETHNRYALELIQRCAEKGILLWHEQGKLKYKAGKDRIDQELLLELKLYKQDVIAYLASDNTAAELKRTFSTTPIQLAYIFGREKTYDLGNVNSHYYLEFTCEQINRNKLEIALNNVIANNEALRTRIYKDGTQEVMDENPTYSIACRKLHTEDELIALRNEWDHHQYELGKWPMFSLFLSDRDGENRIHLSLDCILLDGWSVRMFMEQVLKEYYGAPQQYADFTFREYLLKEKEWLGMNGNHQAAQDYWDKHIHEIPGAPTFRYSRPLSEIEKPHYARLGFELDKKNIDAIAYKAKKYKLTLSLVICVAYMRVLSRWSVNKDLTVNMTLFNRHPISPDISRVLGDFTNITLLSYYADDSKGLLNELLETQEELWRHIEYRTYSGVNLLRKIEKQYPEEAVMPVVFTSMLAGEVSEQEEHPYLDKIEETYALSQTPQVVLDHQIHMRNGELFFSWDFVEQAFSRETIEAMFEDYRKEMEKFVQNDWEQL
ncbi:non-ribosomal peptide synthetase [Clostridium aminobutyricum]|uniref:Amino acid adenylation domain-containing protein n=1 Tax=Clostridium aminobutyricum TaxID=33953 RepID=A0A939DA20_CLOAM|nr:non-ribosomal peptide synthetase [Clostridium aminobutyricum]MBN7773931.1 amino acid adenylation domain-containing protein [Clostridium aminobutyricum]